jgi:hypothetical protein
MSNLKGCNEEKRSQILATRSRSFILYSNVTGRGNTIHAQENVNSETDSIKLTAGYKGIRAYIL